MCKAFTDDVLIKRIRELESFITGIADENNTFHDDAYFINDYAKEARALLNNSK
jgi:hypothetical protein